MFPAVDSRGCLKSGGIAQLGEHLPCKQGVMSSNLIISIGNLKRFLLNFENCTLIKEIKDFLYVKSRED